MPEPVFSPPGQFLLQPGVLNARHLQPAFPGVSKGSSCAETSATPSVSPVTGTLSSVMVSPRRLSDHPAKDLLRAQDVLVPEPVMSSGFPLPSPALDGASPPGCFLGPLPPVFAGTVISRPRARSDFCLFTTVFLPLVPGFPMTCCCLLPGVACRTRMCLLFEKFSQSTTFYWLFFSL